MGATNITVSDFYTMFWYRTYKDTLEVDLQLDLSAEAAVGHSKLRHLGKTALLLVYSTVLRHRVAL